MADPVPTIEPQEMFVGDSLQWDKDLEDYPAGTWTLSYRILPQSGTTGVQTLVATASGTTHQIRKTSSDTGAYTAGTFWMVGYVTTATNRFEIYSGPLTIRENPATATSYDGRTYLQRVLDLLEASIEANEAPRTVIRYSFGGVTSEVRTLEEALKAREQIKAAIAAEAAQASGQQRRILTRFRCPR